jgi:LPS sulfotransferase NodH
MAEKKFVIFGQGRSGSNLLRTLLSSHPQVFCDVELFNPEKLSKNHGWAKYFVLLFPWRHIKQKERLSKKEIYGFKLFVFHLFNVKRLVQRLHRNDWKIIYLERKNILKQAFSAEIGRISKSYLRKKNTPPPNETYRLHPHKVAKAIRKIKRGNRKANIILKDIDHLIIYYEEALKEQTTWPETFGKIFQFLDIEPYELRSNVTITDPRSDRERIENFDEIITFLRANGHKEDVENYYRNL